MRRNGKIDLSEFYKQKKSDYCGVISLFSLYSSPEPKRDTNLINFSELAYFDRISGRFPPIYFSKFILRVAAKILKILFKDF